MKDFDHGPHQRLGVITIFGVLGKGEVLGPFDPDKIGFGFNIFVACG